MKINNQQIKITAFTRNCKIEGLLNLTEGTRLTDLLNSREYEKDFLPLNSAKVTNLTTSETINVVFLSLNKNNIEVIFEEK